MATSTTSTTPAALFVLALLCFGPGTVPMAEACAIGSGDVPFTPALYTQGWAAYRTATCVADSAFSGYRGGVIIEQGLPELKTVGSYAFSSFKGKLLLRGPFPKLQVIQSNAFWDAGSADSVLDFSQGLPELKTVGTYAFHSFNGNIKLGGDYPSLGKCYTQPSPSMKLCRTCAAGKYLDANSNLCATYVI